MTASSRDGLQVLHERFGDRVRFVLVQVREAHPGERTPQPTSLEEKHAHALRLKELLAAPFEVAVDDIEGSFHRSLDPKPNAAYLIGADGATSSPADPWSRRCRCSVPGTSTTRPG